MSSVVELHKGIRMHRISAMGQNVRSRKDCSVQGLISAILTRPLAPVRDARAVKTVSFARQTFSAALAVKTQVGGTARQHCLK